MLVLTRKLQETIKIGDEITVTVLKVSGNKVRIGIEAPRNVRVIRSELPENETETEAQAESHRPPVVAEAAGEVESPVMVNPLADDLISPQPRQNRASYSQRRPRFAMPEVRVAAHTVPSATAK